MILIYTHKITNRVQYTLKLLFTTILGIPVNLINDKDEFLSFDGPKLSYTKKPLATELFFYSKHFLFEKGIKEQSITVFNFEDTHAFFESSKSSVLPFDLFAASFYLVSRYEECLPHIRDQFDRFNAHDSIAYKNDFLLQPVVNIWAQKLKTILQSKFPKLDFPEKKYEYLPTLDIDNAYAYKEKGVIRTIGGILGSFKSGKFKDILYRLQVLSGKKKDPFDTYELQIELHKKYNLKPLYFFLVGDYDVNDKNISIHKAKYQKLIKSMGDYANIGIHPSFNSHKETKKLKKEINALSKVVNSELNKSRQHFLKLTLPDTYRNLIEFDILEDYTMGYATELGFRASICTPFNYYDLDFETETSLIIHPFCIMDATLLYHLKVNPEEVPVTVAPIIESIKKVNGQLITLWHNEAFGGYAAWKGWENVYEDVLKIAVTNSENLTDN